MAWRLQIRPASGQFGAGRNGDPSMTNTHSQSHQGNKPRNAERTGLDFAAEDKYWRETYEREPYYSRNTTYDDYAPAYRVGWEGASRYSGKHFDDVEADLRHDYDSIRGKSSL